MTKRNHPSELLDLLHTAVIVLDEQMCIYHLNAAAEMLLSVSAGRIIGTRLNEFMVHDQQWCGDLRQALRDFSPFSEREKLITMANGQQVTLDCTVTPSQLSDDSVVLILELVQIDRHIRISREEQLFKQQQVTRELVRGMAHEIKNPLGGLRGAAQLLEHELPDPELCEYTRIIIGEADRLQNLVNRMLGPNQLPKPQLVNIHEVLQHVYQLVSVEAAGKAIELQRDYDPSIPDICADKDQLIQIILNIVRNALEALQDSGGIHLRTRVRRQFTIANKRHRLVAMIAIQDTGPGIDPSLMPHIFYPMVTGRSEGTGLGLSIAQSLMNQLGGIIECQSKPGFTEFTIYIPLEKPHE